MSKFYFIDSEFSGKTERKDLCIITDRQRETYLNEMKKFIEEQQAEEE